MLDFSFFFAETAGETHGGRKTGLGRSIFSRMYARGRIYVRIYCIIYRMFIIACYRDIPP